MNIEKVDIENVLSQKGKSFSAKTTVHIHRLFDKLLIDGVFCQSEAFFELRIFEKMKIPKAAKYEKTVK